MKPLETFLRQGDCPFDP
ncbi:hypothetical protein Cabther_A2065 [Chloracidobacterium thermophilum B]|uniref:Uncharacterized protein n=1 Tax=Chloracidobacterium thermophilum (strain B) TaxID=981222 RepID=G2LJC0_CHLTF|nr:hypothetical protein Cabther_A2065 [Chloracidobacterium thermophilum B]